MSAQKEQFLTQSKGCEMYDPCPLCYKCMNKAAHLYRRCQSCQVPHDAHTHKNRAFFIRRDNFALTLTDETKKKLKGMIK